MLLPVISLALAKGTNSMTFYSGNFLATILCLQSSPRHSSLRIFRKIVVLTLSSAMTISRKANNYRVITAAVPNAKDEKEKERKKKLRGHCRECRCRCFCFSVDLPSTARADQ